MMSLDNLPMWSSFGFTYLVAAAVAVIALQRIIISQSYLTSSSRQAYTCRRSALLHAALGQLKLGTEVCHGQI